MNSKFFSGTVGLLAALALVACAPRNPAKPPIPVQAEDKKKTQASESGGQPGLISVYGVIAKNKGEGLKISLETGTGKNGEKAPLADASKERVSETLPENLPAGPSEAELAKVYAFGCSPEQVELYLGRKADNDDLKNKGGGAQIAINAGRVAFCGPTAPEADVRLTIKAQELILDGANVVLANTAGLTLQAEKLTVIGSNVFATVAMDSDDTSKTGGPLTLVVTKEVEFKDQASLTLSAKGSSFKAKP